MLVPTPPAFLPCEILPVLTFVFQNLFNLSSSLSAVDLFDGPNRNTYNREKNFVGIKYFGYVQ